MKIDLMSAFVPSDFEPARETLELFNIERVRSYVEKNPHSLNKQIAFALDLHLRTVAKALKVIRSQLTSSNRVHINTNPENANVVGAGS